MRKVLKIGRFSVAEGLLCAALTLSACLLPQNDDPLPELPPVKNRPPRIIQEQAKPQRFLEVNVSVGCPRELPSVLVEDPDLDDPIRVKWIVYLADSTKALSQLDDPMPIQGVSQLVRPRIEAPPALYTNTPLGTTGTGRRLEVLVADGELFNMGMEVVTLSPIVPLPDGGTIPNTRYIDRYSWNVNTVMGPCP